ncbi:MAG: efflux RND transporter permease subunit, partial [Steroidobacteraceae bacterium]|nr:efflux RND transporter permease subunit [Steroidobacteraceae bacterium]
MGSERGPDAETPEESKLHAFYQKLFTPLLASAWRRWALLAGVVLLLVGSMVLVAVKVVTVKMLPYDNKSELQVVIDMPEGSTLEATAAVARELASVLQRVPEITDMQVYVGTSAPFNFNGLVRQYALRQSPELGDIQVNLVDKRHRERKSHEIALAVRPALAAVAARHGGVVQVVEVPPGPPVQAPIVAEVYGADTTERNELARQLRALFAATPGIVDIDDTVEQNAPRWIVEVDQGKAALLGVSAMQVAEILAIAVAGRDVTYLHAGAAQEPAAVRLELPVGDKSRVEELLALEVRARNGTRVPLGSVASVRQAQWDAAIHHKDLLPVAYVTGDMAGRIDSPLYGMFALVGKVADLSLRGSRPTQYFVQAPDDPSELAVKWDGEWQITYETFRDMGVAYAVGLVLIYLLVVAQFGSYAVPLIIMAPIPLTIIGVMPGHALLGAEFTATSMIGMIALAGIIVRNSILLVDFINAERAAGRPLADAVVSAGAVRAKPIVLTALAAMA